MNAAACTKWVADRRLAGHIEQIVDLAPPMPAGAVELLTPPTPIRISDTLALVAGEPEIET